MSMTWKTIRLELDASDDFPQGSVSRAFLLRLPVTNGGDIDDSAFQREPRRATVRRHWPNEPDRSGPLERCRQGYLFTYSNGDEGHHVLFHIGRSLPRPGERVMIRDPKGENLFFRVAPLNQA